MKTREPKTESKTQFTDSGKEHEGLDRLQLPQATLSQFSPPLGQSTSPPRTSSSPQLHTGMLRCAKGSGSSYMHQAMLQLQRQHGNHFVHRVIELGRTNEGEFGATSNIEALRQTEPLIQDADFGTVGTCLNRTPISTSRSQRKRTDCEEEIKRKPKIKSTLTPIVRTGVDTAIRAGAGSRLPVGLATTVVLLRSGSACGGSCDSCTTDRSEPEPALVQHSATAASHVVARLQTPYWVRPGHITHLQRLAANKAVCRMPSRSRPAARGSGTVSSSAPAVLEAVNRTTTLAEDSINTSPSPPRAAPPPLPRESLPADRTHTADERAGPPPPLAAFPTLGSVATPRGDLGPARPSRDQGRVQRESSDEGGDLLASLASRARSVVSRVKGQATHLWNGLKGKIISLVAKLRTAVRAAMERLGQALSGLRELAQSLWQALGERLQSLGERLREGFAQLRDRLRALWESVKQHAVRLIETLKNKAGVLLERIKQRILSMLGATGAAGGECVTSDALAQVHNVLPGEVTAGMSELMAEATSGLAAAEASGASSAAEGSALQGGLMARAAASIATGSADAAASTARLESGGSQISGDADSAVEGVRGEADKATSEAGSRVEGDAETLSSEAGSSVGRLAGFLGGLASSLLDRASGLVSKARNQVGGFVSSLRERGAALLGRLREGLGSAISQLENAVSGLLTRVRALVGQMLEMAQAMLQRLRGLWDRIKNMLVRVMQAAQRLWSQLSARLTAAWNRLKAAIATLRARAAASLPAADCGPCTFREASERAQPLHEASLGDLDTRAVADLVVALKRHGHATRPAPDPRLVISHLGVGRPLDGSVRGRMEGAFGRSFDRVRLHTNDNAVQLADQMGARAFAVGRHVGFGAGEYRPGTLVGDALLAHELAHVSQQSDQVSAKAEPHQRGDEAEYEDEADRTAIGVMGRLCAGSLYVDGQAGTQLRSGLALRRCGKSKCCDNKPPTGALQAVMAEHDCKPARQSLGDVRAAGGRPTLLGVTEVTTEPLDAYMNKRPQTENLRCVEQCEFDATRPPTLQNVQKPFTSVKEGTHEYGIKKIKGSTAALVTPDGRRVPVPRECRGKPVQQNYIVPGPVADRAAKAEAEHCSDNKRAWNEEIAKYLGAIKELGSGFCRGDESSCKDAFYKLLETRTGKARGVPIDKFVKVSRELGEKLDGPGGRHHEPAPELVEITDDCRAFYRYKE